MEKSQSQRNLHLNFLRQRFCLACSPHACLTALPPARLPAGPLLCQSLNTQFNLLGIFWSELNGFTIIIYTGWWEKVKCVMEISQEVESTGAPQYNAVVWGQKTWVVYHGGAYIEVPTIPEWSCFFVCLLLLRGFFAGWGWGVLPFLVYCYLKFVLVNWNWMIRGIALMTLHQANSHGRSHQPETF